VNFDYSIILAVIFGILPSLIWLTYYLTKDLHPEPKGMILQVFFWGALITLPVFFVQVGFNSLLEESVTNSLLYNLINCFLIIALSEEIFKYLVVKLKVVNSPHLDEPVDVMIYMVVAALGFAAVENILYLFTPMGQMPIDQALTRTLVADIIRFIGATFLHTLCSAVIGYSFAISFCQAKIKHTPIVLGIIFATLLHGLYDFSIMTLDGDMKLAIPATIIITLAFLVFSGFEKIKKMKGLCRTK